MPDTSPPVFPTLEPNIHHPGVPDLTWGMTLRQHYAGLAMQALVQHGAWNHALPSQRMEFAARAFQIADAMVAEAAR